MFRYRNVRHGRVVERAAADEWLEASAGWERLPSEPASTDDELEVELDNDERTED